MQDFNTITYAMLSLAHILSFVYWLGADLAVLYSARYAADPSLSVETRVTISEIMAFVDMFPRMSVPLIGAVGLQLAVARSYIELPWPILLVAWGVAGLWVFNSVYIYRHRRVPATTVNPRRFDVALRTVVVTAAIATVVAGAFGLGPVDNAFIQIKLLLFAAAIVLSLILRQFFKPFRPALTRIVSGAGGDEDARIMQATLARTRPVVLGLWGLTVIAAAVGLWGRL